MWCWWRRAPLVTFSHSFFLKPSPEIIRVGPNISSTISKVVHLHHSAAASPKTEAMTLSAAVDPSLIHGYTLLGRSVSIARHIVLIISPSIPAATMTNTDINLNLKGSADLRFFKYYS